MAIQNDNDKVWVTVDATVNLGNYENMKIQTGMSRTIEEGEDPYELIHKISRKLIKQTEEKIEQIKENHK